MSDQDQFPSHLQMALASIRLFGNDGTLDAAELDQLLELALRDGKVDDDERHVLASIFRQLPRAEVDPEMWRRIEAVRARYSL